MKRSPDVDAGDVLPGGVGDGVEFGVVGDELGGDVPARDVEVVAVVGDVAELVVVDRSDDGLRCG